MLPAAHRLPHRRDITRTVRSGRRAGRPTLVCHLLLADPTAPDEVPPRVAFAVSKAVGDSVTRHRVTRRLRALVAERLDRLPRGSMMVVRALPPAAAASSAVLGADLDSALRRLDVSIDDAGPDPDRAVETAESAVQPPPETVRTPLGRVLRLVGTPLRWALIGLITVYRNVISPVLPPTCRFHPSCSAYALEAVQRHGALKGSGLAGWRLLRCHPWQPGGLDPVPRRGAWRPDIHPDGRPREEGAIRCAEPASH